MGSTAAGDGADWTEVSGKTLGYEHRERVCLAKIETCANSPHPALIAIAEPSLWHYDSSSTKKPHD